jgi:hypothetical protein
MRAGFGAAIVLAGCVAVIAGQTPAPPVRAVPAGALYNVLLQKKLDSATAKANDRFEAGSLEEWKAQGDVVVEIGAVLRGFVSSVRSASTAVGKDAPSGVGLLTLSFDELVLGDKTMKLRASVVNVLDPRRADETRRASTANVVGGEFGLAPLADVMVNRGGSISAMAGGGDVKLPLGVVLRIRIDQALEFPK